ncbi:hypothetical protein DOK78_000870 [Enterococcus sp. DIV2402]|uniref:HTH deoR-type domain-containing protein n=1 Tax=Candidatus Enterococcus lowellii TaxID=2230877 RepID=A0ABZ2SK59_9ENTE|nr:HTH domain-containing protein [Enterococcus sp. DIV2402]MBO0465797.1 HTH domain-containing protein [Enterococcus sp. DIV2402]
MKKTERIHTMIRYINNRAHFTITEIMQEFNISRSTAIRDIREIETMGVPLIAEVGRDGGYSVMHNSFLPPIHFLDAEVKALFVAFMATRNQQLPYLKSRQSLAEKLLSLLSENQQDDLVLLNQLLLFEGTNPYNPDLLDLADLPHPLLEKVIQLLLLNRHITLLSKEKQFDVYVLHLYHEKGNWFIEGIELSSATKQIVAVGQLLDVVLYTGNQRWHQRKPIHESMNLIATLGPKAIAQFKKYHPFKLTLAYTDPYQMRAILRTFVDEKNPEELLEMVNWFLFLGTEIAIQEAPSAFMNALKQRCLVEID